MPSPITPRPYQSENLAAIGNAWRGGAHRVLYQLPTGGGKTTVFSIVVDKFTAIGKRCLVVAHRKELITQGATRLQAVTGKPVGIIKAGITPDYEAAIQVASIQSLARRYDRIVPPDVIVIDEAHHARANSYQAMLERWPHARVLGVTATPVRTDGSGFDDLFDAMVCGPTVSTLIDEGHLSPYRLFADANPMATGGKRGGDYRMGDIEDLNDVAELSGDIVASYQRHCPGKLSIVFCATVAHSKAVADRFNDAGISAGHLDGTTPTEEREAVLAQFAAGQLRVLCNVGLFTEGFDLPALDAVQIARPTMSLALWLQMVGRALRTAPGKAEAIIIDHTTNWQTLGLPDSERRWSLQGVEAAPKKRTVTDGGFVTEVDAPPEPVESDRELVEISAEHRQWLRMLDDLINTAESMGYAKGWVMYRLMPHRPPLYVWQAAGKRLGYHWRWAQRKFDECQQSGTGEQMQISA